MDRRVRAGSSPARGTNFLDMKRDILLTDEPISGVVTYPSGAKRYETEMGPDEVRNIYEVARSKDGELIQKLIDALYIATRYNEYRTFPEEWHNSISTWNSAIEDTMKAGFQPTK